MKKGLSRLKAFLSSCVLLAAPLHVADSALLLDLPTALVTPAAPGSLSPNLAAGPAGILVMSWIEPDSDGHALRFSRMGADGWQAPSTVAHGDNWFVNWADFPSVVPITEEFWVAHWLARRPAGGYAYDIVVSYSNDGGNSWSEGFHPHRDNTDTEHGFVSIYPIKGPAVANNSAATDAVANSAAGAAGLVWLDGRETAKADGGMTLRSATLLSNGDLVDEQQIDNLVCDCCQTDALPTDSGFLVAYRDRTRDEIRDIYVSRRNDTAWQAGTPIAADNWNISGCPVNGPALATAGTSTGIAWFTAVNDKPRVQFSRSVNGGNTFAAPVDVVSGDTFGRVGLALLPDGAAIVSAIVRNASNTAQLSLTQIAADGDRQEPLLFADGVHAFSVPQLVRHGDALFAAWTVRDINKTAIRSARIPIIQQDDIGVD